MDLGRNAGGGSGVEQYLLLILAACSVKHWGNAKHGDKIRTRGDLCRQLNQIVSGAPRRERTGFSQFISIFVLSQGLLVFQLGPEGARPKYPKNVSYYKTFSPFSQPGSFDTSDNIWI